MKFMCEEHGEFWQTPNKHLKSCGCPECGKKQSAITQTKTIDEFIDEANIVFNNLYIYDKSVYINSTIDIEIECKHHGLFWQRPNHHLSGCGCPECGKEKAPIGYGYYMKPDDIDALDICYLYNIKITGDNEEFYKIGISNDYIERHKNLKRNTNYSIEVIDILIDTRYNCWKLEQKLLNKKRRRNILYTPKEKFSGRTECFL